MKTEATVNQNVKINGSGTAGGGIYDEVKINGSGKITGDIECRVLKIDGSGKVQGDVKSESVKFNGSGSFEGNVYVTKMKINGSTSVLKNAIVDDLEINGSSSFKQDLQVGNCEINGISKVYGKVTGGEIKVNGMLKVKESCEVERFISYGAVEIEGLLSADHIELNLDYHSSAKEIGGERISVRQYSSHKMIKHIINFFRQRTDLLEADLIEGDEIDLEITKAKLVRGKKIVIGEKCEIERIEYTDSIEIHPSSKVKESVKI
ncbi:polymer-forming cytoskeletal protein [Bacillus sp. DJP31]|uniref:polymer-forming cytoskeletal protein n=1 Tax=Bacillus sp. DJP31 TaxID=3409789 RepID=UPI003BB7844D